MSWQKNSKGEKTIYIVVTFKMQHIERASKGNKDEMHMS